MMCPTQSGTQKQRMGIFRVLALFLCLAMSLTSLSFGEVATLAAEDETVTVTVNYVYESDKSMVAQPYTAQIKKGSAFGKTLEVPKLFNYSIPADSAEGLNDRIVLSKDGTDGSYTLNFDIPAVEDDITVTLYYKAGTAKYTVYHYYQNLEDDGYTDLPPTTVELVGDIDAYTQAVAENRPGYHCRGVPQTTVAADGTTKVEIFYDRDYYTLTFDVNGGVNGPEPIYAKYGTTFESESVNTPMRKGYIFLGWSPNMPDTVTVTENVTYVAQWLPEKGQSDYTVVLWGQNADDDGYSYLRSHGAWGDVGEQVSWNEDTVISHVHTEECLLTVCGYDEHTHTAECLVCGKEAHSHTSACYPGGTTEVASPLFPPSDPSNGEIYKRFWESDIYYNGTWYEYSGTLSNGDIAVMNCALEEHSHSDACFGCGKTEHTHNSDCLVCKIPDTPVKRMSDIKPSSALWVFDHGDTVTVAADGRTVMNVYFRRTEFTLTFKYGRNNSSPETIEARWGKDISAEYKAIAEAAGSSFWSRKPDASGPYTNYIGVMPAENRTYYNKAETGSNNTMYYYAEDLNGGYEEIFRISFGGSYYVTDEDRYEFDGFTCDPGKSAKNGDSCNGAKFYYTRNSYALEFYSASASVSDMTAYPLFREPLGGYAYIPTSKPTTVEADAVFVGWYLNPECTGEEIDLSCHTMPSHNIALYAKWVNGLYTVTTYTDAGMRTLYTYDGYDGVQPDIEKYTLATAPTPPSRDGYVFVGWFFRDGETEKPFSFTMPVTKDYDLYPKFSEPIAVEYVVHYYKAGTTEKVASDRTASVPIGTAVTEKAKTGAALDLADDTVRNKLYPTNTSTSVIIERSGQEIVFFYTEASSVSYTVCCQDENGNDLIPPVTKTTEYSTVTELYVPIANYAPRRFSITQDLTADPSQNRIVFVYDPTLTFLTVQKTVRGGDADGDQTFLFRIRGTDENTEGIDLTVTVHGNGKTTVADLPVGNYAVTEMTDWSWRYTPFGSETQNVTVDTDGAVAVFENSRADDKWLDGNDYTINCFGPDR